MPSSCRGKKSTSSKPKKEKKDKKKKLKRCSNAFCHYVKEQKATMKSFSGENMKLLADKWCCMTDAEKTPYYQMAEKDKQDYMQRKDEMESQRLKRPCNAFMLFFNDYMAKNKGNYANVLEAASLAGKQWKNMSPQEKDPWCRLEKDALEKYNNAKKSNVQVAKGQKVDWSCKKSKAGAKVTSSKTSSKSAPKKSKSAPKKSQSKKTVTVKSKKTVAVKSKKTVACKSKKTVAGRRSK